MHCATDIAQSPNYQGLGNWRNASLGYIVNDKVIIAQFPVSNNIAELPGLAPGGEPA